MHAVRKLADEHALVDRTSVDQAAPGPPLIPALAGPVSAALERLPAGQLSSRVSLTIRRYGIAHQSLAWLIDQLQRLAQLQQQGWSLQRVYSLKGRRDLRIPEIVYCRHLGPVGLLELMQAFLPLFAPSAPDETLEVV